MKCYQKDGALLMFVIKEQIDKRQNMKKYRLKKSIKAKIKKAVIGILVAISLIAKLGICIFQEDGAFIQSNGYKPLFEIYVLSDVVLAIAIALTIDPKELYND